MPNKKFLTFSIDNNGVLWIENENQEKVPIVIKMITNLSSTINLRGERKYTITYDTKFFTEDTHIKANSTQSNGKKISTITQTLEIPKDIFQELARPLLDEEDKNEQK